MAQSVLELQARQAPVAVSQTGVSPEHCALDVHPFAVQHSMSFGPGQ